MPVTSCKKDQVLLKMRTFDLELELNKSRIPMRQGPGGVPQG